MLYKCFHISHILLTDYCFLFVVVPILFYIDGLLPYDFSLYSSYFCNLASLFL